MMLPSALVLALGLASAVTLLPDRLFLVAGSPDDETGRGKDAVKRVEAVVARQLPASSSSTTAVTTTISLASILSGLPSAPTLTETLLLGNGSTLEISTTTPSLVATEICITELVVPVPSTTTTPLPSNFFPTSVPDAQTSLLGVLTRLYNELTSAGVANNTLSPTFSGAVLVSSTTPPAVPFPANATASAAPSDFGIPLPHAPLVTVPANSGIALATTLSTAPFAANSTSSLALSGSGFPLPSSPVVISTADLTDAINGTTPVPASPSNATATTLVGTAPFPSIISAGNGPPAFTAQIGTGVPFPFAPAPTGNVTSTLTIAVSLGTGVLSILPAPGTAASGSGLLPSSTGPAGPFANTTSSAVPNAPGSLLPLPQFPNGTSNSSTLASGSPPGTAPALVSSDVPAVHGTALVSASTPLSGSPTSPFGNGTLAATPVASGTAQGASLLATGSSSTATSPSVSSGGVPLGSSTSGLLPFQPLITGSPSFTVVVSTSCSPVEITATVPLGPPAASTSTLSSQTDQNAYPFTLPASLSLPESISVPTELLPTSISVPTELLPTSISVPTESLPTSISVPASVLSSIFGPFSVSSINTSFSRLGPFPPVPVSPTSVPILTNLTAVATAAPSINATATGSSNATGTPATPLVPFQVSVPVTTVITTSTTTAATTYASSTASTATFPLTTISAPTTILTPLLSPPTLSAPAPTITVSAAPPAQPLLARDLTQAHPIIGDEGSNSLQERQLIPPEIPWLTDAPTALSELEPEAISALEYIFFDYSFKEPGPTPASMLSFAAREEDFEGTPDVAIHRHGIPLEETPVHDMRPLQIVAGMLPRQDTFNAPEPADNPDASHTHRIITAFLTGLPISTVTSTATAIVLSSGSTSTITVSTSVTTHTSTSSTLTTITSALTTVTDSAAVPSSHLTSTSTVTVKVINGTGAAGQSTTHPIIIAAASKLDVAFCALLACLVAVSMLL